jgi:Trk-type K+ transport system membrane component
MPNVLSSRHLLALISLLVVASAAGITASAAAAPTVTRLPVSFTSSDALCPEQDTITWSGQTVVVESVTEDRTLIHISTQLRGIGVTGTRYTATALLNAVSSHPGGVVEEATQLQINRITAAGEAVPFDDGVAFVLLHFVQGAEAFVKARMFCR